MGIRGGLSNERIYESFKGAIMKTRLKFRCLSVHKFHTGHGVKLQVVKAAGSKENADFFASAPDGVLSLQIMKEQPFERGKEYYLDLVEV